ncbi:transcription-repair coupling factor [Butyrivibrio sp. MC2013]|uniref:transcription-repair coupling factor n=1 Tax=Butyrivibrio sp. MC2013 TaxID=1280686 RepID=UPI000419806C|nr:transcription-repair coupling factor [Butyrivibrio sp. MC2013]
MRAIEAPLQELPAFNKLNKYLDNPLACAEVVGCSDSQKLHLISGLGKEVRFRIIVTESDLKVREIYEGYKFYDKNVSVYPARDLIFYQADVHSNDLTRERIKTLRRLIERKPVTVVTTFAALMSPQIPIDIIRKNILYIDKRHPLDLKEASAALVRMGYEKCYQVEGPGQFSVRGDILDVFDLTEENPYRIELFGDDVESIRAFDIMTQRSLEKLESIEVYPATELILTDDELYEGFEKIDAEADKRAHELRAEFKTEEAARLGKYIKEKKDEALEFHDMSGMDSFLRYFVKEPVTFLGLFEKGQTMIFIDEPAHVQASAEAVFQEFAQSMENRAAQGYILPGQMDLLFGEEEVIARMGSIRRVLLETIPMPAAQNHYDPGESFEIHAQTIAPYNNSFDLLVKDLKSYKKRGYRVLILSGSRTRAKRIVEDLRDNDIVASFSENPGKVLEEGEIMTYYGRILKGFEYPEIRFAVIAESDIFTEHKKKKKRKKSGLSGEAISSMADLHPGDYVVHESHGLGIYRGIEKIESDHVIKDYVKVEYADGGNLYVLATGFDVLQKYASGASDEEKEHKPKLNKLGGSDWARTRNKVKKAVEEVADDLVELYAKRQETKGYAFGKDTVWQQEFEDAFPYDETEDQETAIADTKADMESDKIMDRLVCGDVGFGKTEIAIRAAFKAVQENKQVAVLVPTTILAQQHYNTFSERMKDFPVRVDLLSRFRSSREQKKTLEDLRKGFVDIIIGTHRLLSKDVKYKDLGLLVVDEEQRFGVTHKEKIKKIRENVDVLTLSATPIPRTLHMSLVGIRDMSVLEEAPGERRPIQTFVCEYNEEMVREAVVRELNRKGQVYYVYNRVNDIADVAGRLRKLVPEANVAFAHGQMAEQELEKIMYDFIDGEIDVLVSTTIIETGLDIPNVNTIIISDSDRMGLSQLYQLRGRVGRSNRSAYAFLMYKKNRMLKEDAEKRLSAIREFTDLGSGFKIAMRDLEIRGAGSLLGRKQSGHMMAVGYDMYCKLLSEAVARKKGIAGDYEEDFDTSVDLDIDAYIPSEYILNEEQKLEIYKRIAEVENIGEADDMRDELRDRFGDLPESVDNLVRAALIRRSAHRLYMREVKGGDGEICFEVLRGAKYKSDNIPKLINYYKGALAFKATGRILFIYKYKKNDAIAEEKRQLLENTENLLANMEKALLKSRDKSGSANNK